MGSAEFSDTTLSRFVAPYGVAAGVPEAVTGFRRLKGCGDMPRLVTALRARDQQLGLGASVVNVA